MPARLHLGINTCFATKRWPEPARWVAIVSEVLGLEAAQVTLDHFDPGLDPAFTLPYANEVATRAADAGLVLHSTFTGLGAYGQNLLLHPDEGARRAAEAWFGRALELTAALGAQGTGGFLGALSVADANQPPRRRRLAAELAEAMNRLAERARRLGLSFLLFENMAVGRELGHSIEEARALEASVANSAVPWVLCLDLGHPCALRTGPPSDDPLAWLASPWRHPPVLQLQQANREGDFHWPFTQGGNAAGLLDASSVARALHEGATGDVFLFFEVIHPHEHPDEAVVTELAESVVHWRAALAEEDEGTT